jgi:hypothetical protein
MQTSISPEERLDEARELARKLIRSKKTVRKELIEEFKSDPYLQALVADLKKQNGK